MSKPSRASAKTSPESRGSPEKPDPAAVAPLPANLQALRERTAAIVRMLKGLCGEFPEEDESTCRRGLFLTVVALLFEALCESELTLQDLKEALAMIQERRQAEPRRAGGGRTPSSPAPCSDDSQSTPHHRGPGLPGPLVEAVRSLYGVNLDRPAADSKNRRGNSEVEQGREDHGNQAK